MKIIKKKYIITLMLLKILIVAWFWKSELINLVSPTKNHDSIRILNQSTNQFGPVYIFETEKVRCMSFSQPPSSVVQSCLLIQDPKNILFSYIKLFLTTLFLRDQEPKNILVIGMGGATVITALNNLVPEAKIDIVEINPAILDNAKKYFYFVEGENNKVFIQDGYEFVKLLAKQENNPKKYDIVFLDAFTPDYIPPSMRTDDFIENVKRVTRDNGIVAINSFGRDPGEVEFFSSRFAKHYVLTSSVNKIIIGSDGNLPGIEEISENAKKWNDKFFKLNLNSLNLVKYYRYAIDNKEL